MAHAGKRAGIGFLMVVVTCLIVVGTGFAYLVSASGISGRVEIANGHVQDHTIKLLQGDQVVGTSRTDATGAFAFPEAGDGTYTLVFESYWYPDVSKTVRGNEDSVILSIPDTGLVFAAGWDAGLEADFSVVDPKPSVPVAQLISPGYVGDGAIKPELLYVFPGAKDLLNATEGTIDLWLQLPDDDGVYYVIGCVASGSGMYTISGWGQYHFQFAWHQDGKIDILDAARFPVAPYRGQPIHVTMTWNVPETRMNVYVNGVDVSTALRRSMETGQWTQVEMEEPIPPERLIMADSLVIGSAASGANIYPYALDQLSIRTIELDPAEVLAEYQRKAQYR